MENLKQESINNLTDKLNKSREIEYFNDETGERKKADIVKFTALLEFVKNQPDEYFKKFEKLANITTTYYGCGGHGKARANELAAKEEEKLLNCEIPDKDILFSFGKFNGKGST